MSHLHLRKLTCCNRIMPPWLWKIMANHPIVGVPKLIAFWGVSLGTLFHKIGSRFSYQISTPTHMSMSHLFTSYIGEVPPALCLKFAFHSTNGRPWHAAMWPISPPAAHSLGNPGAKSHTHSKIGAKKLNQGTSCFQQKWLFFFPCCWGFTWPRCQCNFELCIPAIVDIWSFNKHTFPRNNP